MPEESDLKNATDLALTAAWMAGAVVLAYVLGLALTWLVFRVGRRSTLVRDAADLVRRPLRVTLMVIAAMIALGRTTDESTPWRGTADHLLLILLIGVLTWLGANVVLVFERRVIARYAGGGETITDADRHWRRIRTQVITLRRLAIAVVVVLGLAAVLKTFPRFNDIGTGLFASAGVLSVVAGLAAQTSLGAVFAGMQIAFSDAVRVGDVVVLEDEWGRIEEITLTYVVVQLWDQRRLVLPTTYFTTSPFQNWTRNATELLGTVELDLDFMVPFDEMREELQRLLNDSDLWDHRTGILQVTDAVGGHVRVRALVSGPNAGALFDLRCAVREGLVAWLQRTAPGALPQWRVGPANPPDVARGAWNRTNMSSRADSALFTGSEEAERRAREFEGAGVGSGAGPHGGHHDGRHDGRGSGPPDGTPEGTPDGPPDGPGDGRNGADPYAERMPRGYDEG
ncbi:mechanosensitive ion channel family protein [Mycolicibacterium palauense]|uniref:mechanosensitive ion channel family protein n=1 Tax=Mycolicibacterium palauense TaxID=2034511 RepID=UPI000BFEE677|nr:mechanosensitive ion channel domain-containing protein [Mycolicibacterium palauense]